jgi:F5/8 type C domain
VLSKIRWVLLVLFRQTQSDFVSDGSGLPAFSSGVTDFNTYMSGNPSHAVFDIGNAWASGSGGRTGVIDFFLGSQYSIGQLALWNQNASLGHDINSFSIFTSVDGTFLAPTAVGTFNAIKSQTAQVFDLTDSAGAYVRLQINSNHGGYATTLGEIAFDVIFAAVPIPTTIALLSIGLAGLGWSRRKKV